jgi:hypothetical protein
MGKGIYVGVGILVIVALFFLVRPRVNGYVALENFEGNVEFYKSASCGCCGVHSDYLSGRGKLDVDVVVLNDMKSVKDKYGIPIGLESCHTAIIDGYFVEGHVPLEVINRLLEERPNIAGIALPDMPSGTPGMPGVKNMDWVIYVANHDRSYERWMVI